MNISAVDRAAGWWFLCGGAGAALWLSLSLLSVPENPRLTLCLWRNLSGLACPGCGLTRAMVFLAQGEWGRAFEMHPLAPVLVLEALLLWLLGGLWILGHKKRPSQIGLRTWAGAHMVVFIGVWLTRLFTDRLPG